MKNYLTATALAILAVVSVGTADAAVVGKYHINVGNISTPTVAREVMAPCGSGRMRSIPRYDIKCQIMQNRIALETNKGSHLYANRTAQYRASRRPAVYKAPVEENLIQKSLRMRIARRK